MSAPSPPVISNTIPRGTPNLLEFWWDPPRTGTVTQYRIQCSALSIDAYYSASAERYAYFPVPSNNVFYQFQISALNGAAESDPAYYPPWEAGSPSGPPTSIGGQFITPSTLSMNWTAPVTPNTLQYYLAQGIPLAQSNASDILQNVQYSRISTAVITNINPDRAYNFNVRAFTTPGWSAPSDTLTYGRVYGCFITNAVIFASISGVDANGNQAVVCSVRDSTAPVTLYNRYGIAVQTLSAATASSSLMIVYISADGYSNLWIARLSFTGTPFGSTIYYTIKFDSNGNFILPYVLGGNVTVFDKTGATIAALTSSSNSLNGNLYIIKFSSTGVWSGVNDPNTWVTRITLSGNIANSAHGVRIINLIFDSENNIIVQAIATNALGSIQTVTVFDQNQSTIGSGISITAGIAGGTSVINTIFIKYASNGLFTNSWRGYILVTGQVQGIQINQLRLNKYNQIISAVRYREQNCTVYGSDDAVIGSALPFTSSLNIGNSETALIRFCSSGIASLSWRAPIYSSSLNTLSKNDIPMNINIDSNDNIYLTGFSEFGTPGNTTVPLFVCASNDTTFISTVTLGYNNLYTAKYTNTGTPLWVTLFKGTNTTASNANTNFTINFNNGNNQTTPQYLKTFFDRDENLCLVGAYSRGSFDIINRNNTTLYTTALPGNSNISSVAATYAVKITEDGSNASFAIINYLSTPLPQATIVPIQCAVDRSNQLYILENCATNISATATVPVGVFGSNDIITPNLSTNSLGSDGFGLLVKFTSSMSTISMATFKHSTFGGITSTNFQPNYMALDSNDIPIVSGIYRNYFTVSDFGNSSVDFQRQTNVSNAYGLFVTKLTGTPSNSWVGQVSIGGNFASSNANALVQVSGTFQPVVNFGINLSTNSVYTGANTLSSVYTLYDGYNSTVKTMGFVSTNLSNVTFFCSYPSDGRVTLS